MYDKYKDLWSFTFSDDDKAWMFGGPYIISGTSKFVPLTKKGKRWKNRKPRIVEICRVPCQETAEHIVRLHNCKIVIG